jgi:glycosyltransferase involved in cell wall biosynthesis
MVGELVAYKRPDMAVQAFNQMRLPLVVIGGGEMLDDIRRLAGPTVKVMGSQPFEVLKHHYARCRALIFPGEEDFGIVPVEAMASGRPVLAYGRGGALETVKDGLSGLFFENQTIEDICLGVDRLLQLDFNPLTIAAHAKSFSRELFGREMSAHIAQQLERRATKTLGRHSGATPNL